MTAYRYRCSFAGAAAPRVLDVLADDADTGARFCGAVSDAALVELLGAVDLDAYQPGPELELVRHEWDGFGVHDPHACETCEMLAAVHLEFVAPWLEWLETPAGRFSEWDAVQCRP